MKKIKKKERIKENIITREVRFPIKILKENVLFFILIFTAMYTWVSTPIANIFVKRKIKNGRHIYNN